jgi:cysteinyl-tRNA synthetase
MLIYNSLTRSKDAFVPLNGKRVTIYSCGPTPYDYSHIGHARGCILWDVITRYLKFRDYEVVLVRNITDIEDKIINRAKKLGIRPEQVARKFLFEFWRDMDALNVQPPDFEPRATEYLSQMIDFVAGLIERGHAYPSYGDVYFDVASAASYGKLTKQSLEEMLVGSRDQVLLQSELEERKKNAADFALWKGSKDGEPGWSSPWGFGRPGWHLECSTMIKSILGETIDLHGGGEDLLFPHHENEIAQSEGLHAKPLARFFVHHSFVQVNSEKMAKSTGNFTTIREILKDYAADDIRLFLLQTHYRNPIDFSSEGLSAARTAGQRLAKIASLAAPIDLGERNGDGRKQDLVANSPADKPSDKALDAAIAKLDGEFIEAMDNDFNTAIATAALFNFAEIVSKESDQTRKQVLGTALRKYANILGLSLSDTRKHVDSHTAAKLVDLTLQIRAQSKLNKDYATSDLIRAELTKYGITVMDTATGSTWEAS